jgi:restriction system protein
LENAADLVINKVSGTEAETVSEKISEQAAGLASVEPVRAVSGTVVDISGKEIEEVQAKSLNQLICPRCGSELVLRTARKGANAGNQFYGCSSFPKCRYTQTLG